jgi:UPF0271 protein
MTMAGSTAADVAEAAGVRVVAEVFADRAYTGTGRLLDRRLPGAVIHDPDVIAHRVVTMVTSGTVSPASGAAGSGTTLDVRADSVCVHGDTPDAVRIARRVRAALESAGVAVRPWE